MGTNKKWSPIRFHNQQQQQQDHPMDTFETATGYVPGLIGRVAQLHAQYYAEHWNFGYFFEAKVATEFSGFISNFNETRDCVWSLSVNGNIEGSITIHGSSKNLNVAHLRWFILSDSLRGKGVGNYLMKQALSFCKQKEYEKVYLWTFQGLDPARHLYEKYGFRLVEERSGSQWGSIVIEQRFEAAMPLPPKMHNEG
jgi:GNAT superfamily N-acetyltransferase